MNTKLNIFNSSCQTIVIPVNTVGVMGAGLAKEFANKFPDGLAKYKSLCSDKSIRLGNVTFSDIGDKKFCFFPTKGHWKDNSSYEDILTSLRYLYKVYKNEGVKSIVFPRIGCGLGGLDWDIVIGYIKKFSGNVDIPVEIIDDSNNKIIKNNYTNHNDKF